MLVAPFKMKRLAFLFLAFVFIDGFSCGVEAKQIGLCRFDTNNFDFEGTVAEQTACLLRRVELAATGSTLQPVPEWLLVRAGGPTDIPLTKLSKYLCGNGFEASTVGGTLPTAPDITEKKYFVIHDTSYPEIKFPNNFPENINKLSYSVNKLDIWARTPTARKVNVITNRLGASFTLQVLTKNRPSPATKLEENARYPKSRKVFLHVENVQPRLQTEKHGPFARGPKPGFTPAQMERLALIYVVASIRADHWLIPAFHFNIDSGVSSDPHDDPQNFDLATWVKDVQSVVERVNAQ